MPDPDIRISIGAPNYPVLNEFMGCKDRVSFIMGPLGSGKTYAACQRLLKHMKEQEPNEKGERPTRWCAVRNTYPDLMTTTVRDFQEVFRGLGTMKLGSLEPPTFTCYFRLEDKTIVKSEVIFLALDREDSEKKLRGLQVTGFWLNETKELIKPIVDMADMRHGRYPSRVAGGVLPTWHGMFGDLNAPDEDHWYYHLAEEVRPEGWKFFRQPGGMLDGGKGIDGLTNWIPNEDAENLANLPEGYYIRGRQAKSEGWIAVNLANQYGFVVEGKPVHPEFRDHVHTHPELLEVDKAYPLVIGLDFGRTPAAAILQFIEPMGRWHVIDEYVTHDMSASRFAPELKLYLDRTYPGMAVSAWGDPAGDHAGQTVETTPIEILRAHGIPCQPCHTNETLIRRSAVTNPLMRNCMDGRAALIVSPKAKMIRKGLRGGFCYRRMKVPGEDRFTELPDKNIYSHPVEALEYGLMGAGEGRRALVPGHAQRRRERLPTQAVM